MRKWNSKEENFFAVDTVRRFSIDLYNWYYEGQYIDLVTKKETLPNSLILAINENDRITIKASELTRTINSKDIQAICCSERRRLMA